MRFRLLKIITSILISLLFLLINLFIPSPTSAQIIDCQSGFQSLSPGITYKKIITNQPRDMVIHAAKVNLNHPGIGLFVTPRDNIGTTTGTFLNTFDLQLAINTNNHTVFNDVGGIIGLAASSGDIYSKTSSAGHLFASQDGQVTIRDKLPSTIWHAVTATHNLIINNKTSSKIDNCLEPAHCENKHARTSAGLAGNHLIIIIVEDTTYTGQTPTSLGATLPDLVDMFQSCNAHSALNFDGGSSSTLVSKTRGLLNNTRGGIQVGVPVHLGVCLNNCDQLIPQSATPTSTANFSFTPSTSSTPVTLISKAVQKPHPLRPYPNQLTDEERSHSINDPNYTLYCAQRPTAVKDQPYYQNQRIDCPPDVSAENCIQATFQGILTQNFEAFYTPFLSMTDIEHPDYNLSYNEKARRYLADFLEGRAYYEPQAEPATPDFSQLFQKLGVFRELAPSKYQHQLKRAMIYRSVDPQGYEDDIASLYGFRPFTLSLNKKGYLVGCWNGNRVVNANYTKKEPCGKNQAVMLKHFYKNWTPLLKDFDTLEAFASASAEWKTKNNGKWFSLWPYVPMFTREDSKAKIISIPEEGQQNDQVLDVTVKIPHLARIAEVVTALTNLLTPLETHTPVDPSLTTRWDGRPWNSDPYWLESKLPDSAKVGPVCEPQPPNLTLTSSGDKAHDRLIETSVNIPAGDERGMVAHPNWDPDCDLYWGKDPNTGRRVQMSDPSRCEKTVEVKYSPNYLYTYTPHLNTIMDKLVSGEGALFSALFKLTGLELDQEPPQNWPAYGMPLDYDYTEGGAVAGLSSDNQGKYFFKYLGYVHCIQERVLEKLQPFLLGTEYQYFSPECGPRTEYSGFPGIYATGSCPIPDGFVSCASYNPQSTSCNHGSNDYWAGQSLKNKSQCGSNGKYWALPSMDSSCWYSPYPGDICYDKSSTCDYYGFAADFAYSDRRANAPVIYPEIDGQILEWEVIIEIPLKDESGKTIPARKCSGAGATLRAEAGGNVYEIYMTHLNDVPSGGRSGEIASTLFDFKGNGCNGSPHVHLELKINGTYVRPDDLCN